MDISGTDLDKIIITALELQRITLETLGKETQISPRPSLEILYPEINLYPNNERLKAVGLDAQSFGITIDVLMDGRKISEYKEEGREKLILYLKPNNHKSLPQKNSITPQSTLQMAESCLFLL